MRSTLTISLPPELARRLEEEAKALGRTKSELVREALSDYLWRERFERIRRHLRPYAQKAGFITEEDVFRAIS